MPREIVMIGTALDSRSGIAAVVNVYAAQGLFRRWRARYLATHADGGALRKLGAAARAGLAFLALAASGRAALLHVQGSCGMSFWRKSLFAGVARAFRVPYLLHLHGGRFMDFYRRECGPLRRALVRRVLRGARSVVVLSEEWRSLLSGIEPRARYVVVPNPIEIPAWQAGLDAGPPTVLFLGVLREAKGVYDLLRAWPAVLRRVPHARLVLGGDGETEAVRRAARELGIEASVELPGWVRGEAKTALLRRAWALALPSHWEALPMAVLEAMAAGVPVVATRVGAVPEAVEDGVSGLLVAPRDPDALAGVISGLLLDPALRASVGAAGRQRAIERFSAAALVPQIEALWRAELRAADAARLRVDPATNT